ncbi:hypothetical protein [Halococcus agarilyticus]|nr:hypothetical protein [Halococcus agarilyticus]
MTWNISSILAANAEFDGPGEGHVVESDTYRVTVDDSVSSFGTVPDGA